VQNIKKIYDIDFHGVADLIKFHPDAAAAGFTAGLAFGGEGFWSV